MVYIQWLATTNIERNNIGPLKRITRSFVTRSQRVGTMDTFTHEY